MTSDFLASIAQKMGEVDEHFAQTNILNNIIEKIIKIDPNDISNWEYRDRQDFELGNIEELADSIQNNGQAQPIVVVKTGKIFSSSESKASKYIVIAGYRRWLACKSRNIFIDAIVRDMTFEQAIGCLVSENEKEKVSDYSKGMFYSKLLKKEDITKKKLYEKLGINRCVFDNLISFSEVPEEIWAAVGDMSKVSSRTSSTIKMLCGKGSDFKEALIAIASKISEGIGEKKIIALVNSELKKSNHKEIKENATRVAFSDFVFLEHKKNKIKLEFKNLDINEIEILKTKISNLLNEYVKNTLLDTI